MGVSQVNLRSPRFTAPSRFYRYTDEKIAQIAQALSRLEFAPERKLTALELFVLRIFQTLKKFARFNIFGHFFLPN